jgi:hypothetical protein
MLPAYSLPENEGILRADRDDQCPAECEACSERCRKHGATVLAEASLVHLNFLKTVNGSLIAMFDYSSLAAVATVVQEGSFERAARALNVTPSAISQRIKLLEERLGAVLIARGQPCTATDTGRLLCRHLCAPPSPKAVAAFRESEDVLLDVSLDDQEHTVNLLRSGHVLAAVTANAHLCWRV